MVLVRTQQETFDMEPEWLAMFYNRQYPIRLPIRNQAAAEELLKYVQEDEKKNRMFKKIRRSDRLDAYHTGMPFRIRHEKVREEEQQNDRPRPRSEIDIRMKDVAASFKDYELLYDVARGARKLFWTTLYETIVEHEAERLAAIGFNGSHSLEDAQAYLFFETYL